MRSIGWHYEEARRRIDEVVRPLPAEGWQAAVPACPGWRVHDVVAHLLGNTEDGAAGRITGVPDEALTAEQVERHGLDAPHEMLDRWELSAPLVAAALDRSGLWPAAIDAVTHEHDLRGALGRPGSRDHESVDALAARLGDQLGEGPGAIAVEVDGDVLGDPAAGLRLRTTSFELFRLRMGRRSVRQVRALDWSADPTDHLDRLFVFGPATDDVVE